jgi:hypothetical protein
MGLGFTTTGHFDVPETPHWSYGGFMRFRIRVAESVGIDLMLMEGVEDFPYMSEIPVERGIVWTGNNPINEFLSHSDCDGSLSADSCEKIAPILKQIICDWKDQRFVNDSWLQYDINEGLKLVNMMFICANTGERLLFV